MQIKDCKLRKIISCDKNENMINVAKKLKDNKSRHIIITDSKKPIGIISTTDINNRVVAKNKDLKKTKAKDIMTSKILLKNMDESIAQAYIEMIQSNIFSCPIVENGKFKGILDLKEAMNHLVKANIKK